VIGNGDFYVIVAEQVSTNETTYARHIGDCETLLEVRSAKLQVCEDIGVADRAANPDQLAYRQGPPRSLEQAPVRRMQSRRHMGMQRSWARRVSPS
jgi:hypothetical protein